MKHIVGFSGGIDSQATARWVLNRYPAEDVILLFSNAGGWEDPITPAFVAEYSMTVHPVITVESKVSDMWETPGWAEKRGYDGNAKLTYKLMCEIKGRAPSRKAQFCTEKLKLIPQKRWVEENLPDGDYERYTGVRRDESEKRKNTPLREWDTYFDCYVNHPICHWPKNMCFEFVKRHDGIFNPLYQMGFSRVGCAPCVNSGKDDILLWLQRRPEMIEKIRDFEKELGFTYFAPIVPGMKINFIDDVILWAQTSRGGRQTDLLRVLNDHPACESKYGLCE
ncbi:phosphoadenosine phosphosulfate reductase family protein [Candidatus Manganitrophus noduliformans]|uniref:Phosphoadenosine phosphosulfate reductase family protein n=1 Tax=Candidatus Manganitrophus noduliformans TaxID=2606439 RepID=A0A7X6I9Y7_9BACT|nr:phosphoadenosine phosphosulfate reductase family protein [Candidatus Manganitrophus noduliformans]NKE69850.1 phosphoadenosine phosphosulfate reductase family protein [Candidatus Manganitrophus noduliformans]